MDKRIIFAVAGAGKTSHIIDSLSLETCSIIITYTENNFLHLRTRIIQKFGAIPENITVLTYFTFLYSFCYKPFLHDRYRAKGISWDVPPEFTLRLKRSDSRFYVDNFGRLYNNRIAKLVEQEKVQNLVTERLGKYFDQFFVDEVQDFGGHDFNLLIALLEAPINITLVGDFYQHTFDTSRDGVLHRYLYDDFEIYKTHFLNAGLVIDMDTLSHSYRNTPEVCDFISKNLGINIQSHKRSSSNVRLVTDDEEIMEIFASDETAKLFFRDHGKYPCFSQNWGKSKGQDHYIDVCVMLYPAAMKAFDAGRLSNLPSSSRNKLYVACTRANNDLLFVEESRVRHLKS